MPDFFGRIRALAHDFPLRSTFTAQLILPVDLTTKEAKQLAAFILSLAQDDDEREVG